MKLSINLTTDNKISILICDIYFVMFKVKYVLKNSEIHTYTYK